MLRIEPPGCTRSKPVVDSDGARLGTVFPTGDDDRRVSVSADAPADTLDALGWVAGDDVRLPDRLVADDADDTSDVLRLVV